MRRLLEACEGRCHLVMVSDEVGQGLVPTYPSGRRYLELLGRLNQSAVVAVDTVYLIVAGLPMVLKGEDLRRGEEQALW
jgi:adenosyl cobinamide kinase/adenosyl cobinamide phosphate guanylyltransferase